VTVRCPGCGTRFRLPPRSALGTRPTFRCTRCEQVFDPEGSAEAPSLEDAVAPAALLGDSVAEADEGLEDDGPAEEGEPSAGLAPSSAVAATEEDAAAVGRGETTATARFALRTLLFVSIGYAILSIWIFTHSDRVMAWLADVPFVGASVTEVRIDPSSIQLVDVRGTYHRIQGDTLVFVVSGNVINNAPVAVSGVQVQGAIYGTVDERATVFAGVAPRQISELTLREIELLQGLVPPAEWSLGPGEQASFLVVFTDPVLPLEEFSAEVVAVRRSKHRRLMHAQAAG